MSYREIVADRAGLWIAGTHRPTRSLLEPERLDGLAATIAYVRDSSREPVVLWIHESAHELWHLPETAGMLEAELRRLGVISEGDDAVSSPGWVRVSPYMHLALPALSGDFAGLESGDDLARALALFRELVGMQFMFSAPSTILSLIGAKYRPPSLAEPAGVPYAGSAFAIPAHTWTRAATAADRELPAVQLFDRRASYLAAWASCILPVGRWRDIGDGDIPTGLALAKAAGYYLIDVRPLTGWLAAQRLHNPFARPEAQDLNAPIWLTQPLAELALELSQEAQITVCVQRAVIAEHGVRALDLVAQRLGDARRALEAPDSPAWAPAVAAVIKDGYTRATAHFEFGKRPGHPLYRPAWRHTIIERSVANTYRALRRALRRPLVVGGIDAAIFPVVLGDGPSAVGLAEGPNLGTWRARGTPMPRATALRRLGRKRRDVGTNARELIAALASS